MLKFRNLCGLKACFLGCICAFLFSYSALADVCFLPTGGCVALDSLYSQTIGGADDDCSGYDREIKGQGWDCTDTCEAHGHTYYNCVPKNCGAGYQPGINSCERGYTHEYEKAIDEGGNETYVYSGDLKCGLCVAPGECPLGSQVSDKCENRGYLPRDTQYYVGTQVCHVCLSDNCADGMKKYCSWSSGSTSGPSGSNRATSDEWYTSTARTQYGSMCYACCDNKCTKGSQEVTSCDPSTEIFRTLETTACGSACNECCNNVCSSGSLNTTSCDDGYYLKNHGTTDCGNSCDSCEDCGGTTTAPTGCSRCTKKECGNQTRYYDCYDLSDECSTGSKDVTCTYANDVKTSVGSTDCGSTCYSCVCTPTADETSDDSTCKTSSYSCDNGCGGTRTCYQSACSSDQVCYNSSCCTPAANETSDDSTCKTSSYSCSDGCGGTRTCYQSACSSGQVCYNSSCCTPAADETSDSSTCKTSSYSCDNGCGGTRTCYQSACSSDQTCQNGTCVDNCSPSKTCASYSMSSESGGCYSTTAETKSDGCTDSLTCYAYACSGDQSCDNGTCVDKGCPDGTMTEAYAIDNPYCGFHWQAKDGSTYQDANGDTVQCGIWMQNTCNSGTTSNKSCPSGYTFKVTNSHENSSCGTTECGKCEKITCTGGYTSLSDCNSAMGSYYSYNHKCFGPYSGCYYLYCDDSKGYYDDEQMCDMETGGPCEEKGHCFVKSSGSSGGDDCTCDYDTYSAAAAACSNGVATYPCSQNNPKTCYACH